MMLSVEASQPASPHQEILRLAACLGIASIFYACSWQNVGNACEDSLVFTIVQTCAYSCMLRWQGLSQALWAVAVVAPNPRPVSLLRAATKEIGERLRDFGAVELPTLLWALATLQFHPGPLLDDLAYSACACLPEFNSQVLPRAWRLLESHLTLTRFTSWARWPTMS